MPFPSPTDLTWGTVLACAASVSRRSHIVTQDSVLVYDKLLHKPYLCFSNPWSTTELGNLPDLNSSSQHVIQLLTESHHRSCSLLLLQQLISIPALQPRFRVTWFGATATVTFSNGLNDFQSLFSSQTSICRNDGVKLGKKNSVASPACGTDVWVKSWWQFCDCQGSFRCFLCTVRMLVAFATDTLVAVLCRGVVPVLMHGEKAYWVGGRVICNPQPYHHLLPLQTIHYNMKRTGESPDKYRQCRND